MTGGREKVTVYRVQDKEGRGPWKPGFSRQWVEPRQDLENLPPWFYEFGRFGMGKTRAATGCACRTLDQLRRWFTLSEYTKLQRYGYRAVRLDVDRILAESGIQCVFEREKPLRLDVEPVDLYK